MAYLIHPTSTTKLLLMYLSILAALSSFVALSWSAFVPSLEKSMLSIARKLPIGHQSPLMAKGDDTDIPGNSPIELCAVDEPHFLDIESVTLDPNPPVPGANLTIKASGVLETDVVDGAYVDIVVNYGFITLVRRTFDLCELLPEVDMECPVEKGFLSVTREVEIPDGIPPGEYSIHAEAYTVGDDLLTCLNAVVEFE